MDLFEILSERRSIRRFSDEPVSRENVETIIRAAIEAPSSKNTRSSGFIVVENPDVIKRIAAMRDYGSAFVEKAPLVILVTGDGSKTDLWSVNSSISATYVQLAAEALGLGNCWVHVDGRAHKQDDPSAGTAEEYLRGFIDIPQNVHVLCAIAVGHKLQDDVAPVRKKHGDENERVVIIK